QESRPLWPRQCLGPASGNPAPQPAFVVRARHPRGHGDGTPKSSKSCRSILGNAARSPGKQAVLTEPLASVTKTSLRRRLAAFEWRCHISLRQSILVKRPDLAPGRSLRQRREFDGNPGWQQTVNSSELDPICGAADARPCGAGCCCPDLSKLFLS